MDLDIVSESIEEEEKVIEDDTTTAIAEDLVNVKTKRDRKEFEKIMAEARNKKDNTRLAIRSIESNHAVRMIIGVNKNETQLMMKPQFEINELCELIKREKINDERLRNSLLFIMKETLIKPANYSLELETFEEELETGVEKIAKVQNIRLFEENIFNAQKIYEGILLQRKPAWEAVLDLSNYIEIDVTTKKYKMDTSIAVTPLIALYAFLASIGSCQKAARSDLYALIIDTFDDVWRYGKKTAEVIELMLVKTSGTALELTETAKKQLSTGMYPSIKTAKDIEEEEKELQKSRNQQIAIKTKNVGVQDIKKALIETGIFSNLEVQGSSCLDDTLVFQTNSVDTKKLSAYNGQLIEIKGEEVIVHYAKMQIIFESIILITKKLIQTETGFVGNDLMTVEEVFDIKVDMLNKLRYTKKTWQLLMMVDLKNGMTPSIACLTSLELGKTLISSLAIVLLKYAINKCDEKSVSRLLALYYSQEVSHTVIYDPEMGKVIEDDNVKTELSYLIMAINQMANRERLTLIAQHEEVIYELNFKQRAALEYMLTEVNRYQFTKRLKFANAMVNVLNKLQATTKTYKNETGLEDELNKLLTTGQGLNMHFRPIEQELKTLKTLKEFRDKINPWEREKKFKGPKGSKDSKRIDVIDARKLNMPIIIYYLRNHARMMSERDFGNKEIAAFKHLAGLLIALHNEPNKCTEEMKEIFKKYTKEIREVERMQHWYHKTEGTFSKEAMITDDWDLAHGAQYIREAFSKKDRKNARGVKLEGINITQETINMIEQNLQISSNTDDFFESMGLPSEVTCNVYYNIAHEVAMRAAKSEMNTNALIAELWEYQYLCKTDAIFVSQAIYHTAKQDLHNLLSYVTGELMFKASEKAFRGMPESLALNIANKHLIANPKLIDISTRVTKFEHAEAIKLVVSMAESRNGRNSDGNINTAENNNWTKQAIGVIKIACNVIDYEKLNDERELEDMDAVNNILMMYTSAVNMFDVVYIEESAWRGVDLMSEVGNLEVDESFEMTLSTVELEQVAEEIITIEGMKVVVLKPNRKRLIDEPSNIKKKTVRKKLEKKRTFIDELKEFDIDEASRSPYMYRKMIKSIYVSIKHGDYTAEQISKLGEKHGIIRKIADIISQNRWMSFEKLMYIHQNMSIDKDVALIIEAIEHGVDIAKQVVEDLGLTGVEGVNLDLLVDNVNTTVQLAIALCIIKLLSTFGVKSTIEYRLCKATLTASQMIRNILKEEAIIAIYLNVYTQGKKVDAIKNAYRQGNPCRLDIEAIILQTVTVAMSKKVIEQLDIVQNVIDMMTVETRIMSRIKQQHVFEVMPKDQIKDAGMQPSRDHELIKIEMMLKQGQLEARLITNRGAVSYNLKEVVNGSIYRSSIWFDYEHLKECNFEVQKMMVSTFFISKLGATYLEKLLTDCSSKTKLRQYDSGEALKREYIKKRKFVKESKLLLDLVKTSADETRGLEKVMDRMKQSIIANYTKCEEVNTLKTGERPKYNLKSDAPEMVVSNSIIVDYENIMRMEGITNMIFEVIMKTMLEAGFTITICHKHDMVPIKISGISYIQTVPKSKGSKTISSYDDLLTIDASILKGYWIMTNDTHKELTKHVRHCLVCFSATVREEYCWRCNKITDIKKYNMNRKYIRVKVLPFDALTDNFKKAELIFEDMTSTRTKTVIIRGKRFKYDRFIERVDLDDITFDTFLTEEGNIKMVQVYDVSVINRTKDLVSGIKQIATEIEKDKGAQEWIVSNRSEHEFVKNTKYEICCLTFTDEAKVTIDGTSGSTTFLVKPKLYKDIPFMPHCQTRLVVYKGLFVFTGCAILCEGDISLSILQLTKSTSAVISSYLAKFDEYSRDNRVVVNEALEAEMDSRQKLLEARHELCRGMFDYRINTVNYMTGMLIHESRIKGLPIDEGTLNKVVEMARGSIPTFTFSELKLTSSTYWERVDAKDRLPFLLAYGCTAVNQNADYEVRVSDKTHVSHVTKALDVVQFANIEKKYLRRNVLSVISTFMNNMMKYYITQQFAPMVMASNCVSTIFIYKGLATLGNKEFAATSINYRTSGCKTTVTLIYIKGTLHMVVNAWVVDEWVLTMMNILMQRTKRPAIEVYEEYYMPMIMFTEEFSKIYADEHDIWTNLVHTTFQMACPTDESQGMLMRRWYSFLTATHDEYSQKDVHFKLVEIIQKRLAGQEITEIIKKGYNCKPMSLSKTKFVHMICARMLNAFQKNSLSQFRKYGKSPGFDKTLYEDVSEALRMKDYTQFKALEDQLGMRQSLADIALVIASEGDVSTITTKGKIRSIRQKRSTIKLGEIDMDKQATDIKAEMKRVSMQAEQLCAKGVHDLYEGDPTLRTLHKSMVDPIIEEITTRKGKMTVNLSVLKLEYESDEDEGKATSIVTDSYNIADTNATCIKFEFGTRESRFLQTWDNYGKPRYIRIAIDKSEIRRLPILIKELVEKHERIIVFNSDLLPSEFARLKDVPQESVVGTVVFSDQLMASKVANSISANAVMDIKQFVSKVFVTVKQVEETNERLRAGKITQGRQKSYFVSVVWIILSIASLMIYNNGMFATLFFICGLVSIIQINIEEIAKQTSDASDEAASEEE